MKCYTTRTSFRRAEIKSIEQFLAKVNQWARAQQDIAGLVLVGSWARGEAQPDSDVDLKILCDTPSQYLNDRSWPKQFGPIKSQKIEEWGKVGSVRVQYQNHLEVEFGFSTPDWVEKPLDPGTSEVLSHAFKILFDRSGKLNAIQNDEY